MRGKELAGYGVAALFTAGCLYYIADPSVEIDRDAIGHGLDAVHDAFAGDNATTTTPNTEAAATCMDISKVDPAIKIGSLIVPIANISPKAPEGEPINQYDLLVRMMTENKVSNYATTNLSDQVLVGDQQVPLTDALGNLKNFTATANGIKTTSYLDVEGGIVDRTRDLTGYTALPSAEDQAGMPPADLTNMFVNYAGRLKMALGVDVVFGPDADVGRHKQIGHRSYGESADEVVGHAGIVADALRSSGLDITFKHFPGLGFVDTDTHFSTGVTPTLDVMMTESVPAFTRLIADHDPKLVMVSHASTKGLGADGLPASLNPAAYSLLRDQSGFKGIAITDSADMDALQTYLGAPDEITAEATATVMALAAGATQVIVKVDSVGGDGGVVAAINTALSNGTLSQAIVDNDAAQVLRYKGYDICQSPPAA